MFITSRLTSCIARVSSCTLIAGSLLSPCSGIAQVRPAEKSAEIGWSELRYSWRSLQISIRTDAGLFSPALQKLRQDETIGPFSTDKLVKFVQGYFVMTSGLRSDGEQDDFCLQFDRVLKQWGLGHTMPVIAAVAIENITRPIPSVFVKRVDTFTAKDLSKMSAASIDPSKRDSIRVTVYSKPDGFRDAAQRSGHGFARAYYNAAENEIGLMLDMERFRRLYSNIESDKDRRILMLPAFISFVSEAFNDDSGHEITHFMQRQSSHKAYTLPAIAEGEAEVHGYTRSRNGLIYSLMYNTPEAWTQGQFDSKRLKYRVELMLQAGRPPASPFEVQRFQELRALAEQAKTVRVADLLARTTGFYDGDESDVWSRYLHSWALYLMAVRDGESAELLRNAVIARVSGQPASQLERALDAKLKAFIADPVGFKVTTKQILADAERVYATDPSFAGLFYAWAYIADPFDVRAIVYLGDSLYRGGDLSSAEKYYREARRLRPMSALPLLRLGDVEAQAGNREKAIALWAEAIRTTSKDDGEEMYRSLARKRSQEFSAAPKEGQK
jgi:tetratricopeptide (TPR) repeat protein